MAEHCLNDDDPGKSNEITFFGPLFNSRTEWHHADSWDMLETTTDSAGASCLITAGKKAQAQPRYTANNGSFKLLLQAERSGSTAVAKQFQKYVQEHANNIFHTCPKNSNLPTDLNFAFCGKLKTDLVTIPLCLAQGKWSGDNNWVVASPIANAQCIDNETAQFRLSTVNQYAEICTSKIGCNLLGGKDSGTQC